MNDGRYAREMQVLRGSLDVGAKSLGLDAKYVELIKYASPMHDVGKVGIPDVILLKPGHLTPAQRRTMHRHMNLQE